MSSSVVTEIEWDLADRLRKALRIGGASAGEMADYLGVHRTTVSGWLVGRQEPRVGMLRLWAMRCGVPFEWLSEGECAVRDLNPEPADSELAVAA